MDTHRDADVSMILRRVDRGETPPQELFEAVYTDLRGLAAQHMRGERQDHSLQPTILVHEAWMRLEGREQVGWQGRAHFFGAAAQAMRCILVDHARRRGAAKRGAGMTRLPLDALELIEQDDQDGVLAIDDAMERLEQRDPRLAEVVRLRFWAGLDEKEAAELLDVSYRTVRRDWKLARTWLIRELGG